MQQWGMSAGIFGGFIAATAVFGGVIRRPRLTSGAVAVGYAVGFMWLSTRPDAWVHLVMPGAALLAGYWLTQWIAAGPQAGLEAALLRQDREVFRSLGIDRLLRRAPDWLLELVEGLYLLDYIVVGGGALLAGWIDGVSAAEFWGVVLPAELACYAALPWLRARPPRMLEAPGAMQQRRLALRQVTEALLGKASVGLATIPSGHVAGAVAASLAFASVSGWLGAGLLAISAGIAASTVLGRYHYTIDAVTGALTGAAAALLAT